MVVIIRIFLPKSYLIFEVAIVTLDLFFTKSEGNCKVSKNLLKLLVFGLKYLIMDILLNEFIHMHDSVYFSLQGYISKCEWLYKEKN